MTRYLFAGGPADWTFTDGTADAATLVGSAVVTFWNAVTGGTQYTDLAWDQAGTQPITGGQVTTSDGTNGIKGAIPAFYGPDNVTQMWAYAGDKRLHMTADTSAAALIGATHAAAGANPHGTSLAQLADVLLTSPADGQYLGRAAGLWKNLPGPGGGGSLTDSLSTLFVAAAGASAEDLQRASVLCDGTADDVQIQAAINTMQTLGGGRVQLSTGEFTIAATINLLGTDDTGDEHEVFLVGMGPGNTRLIPATGTPPSTMIHLGQCVRAHIWDMDILVTGSTTGITSTRSTGTNGDNRGFWLSSFERLEISGPGDNTHTGWAMNLGSPFRSRFANIEIGGVGNGIRLYSETDNFNPGDCTFDRIFVDTWGAGHVALNLHSDAGAGTLNHLWFNVFEAYDNSGASTAVLIDGDNQPARIVFQGLELEQYATVINLDSAQGVEAWCNYLTPSAAGTVFKFGTGAYNNIVHSNQVGANGANTVLVNDQNTSTTPNQLVDVRLETFSAGHSFIATFAQNSTVRRNITHAGSGTVAAGILAYPRVYAPLSGVVTLTDGATVALDARAGNYFRLTAVGNRTISAPTNPTDGQIITIEHIASGGSRTLTLTTGSSGAFVFGSSITALSATSSGLTDIIEATYSATKARWLVTKYVKGY